MKTLYLYYLDGHDCSGKSWAAKRFSKDKLLKYDITHPDPINAPLSIWLLEHKRVLAEAILYSFNSDKLTTTVVVDRSPLSLIVYKDAYKECFDVFKISQKDIEIKLIFNIFQPQDKHYFLFLKDKFEKNILNIHDIISLDERKLFNIKYKAAAETIKEFLISTNTFTDDISINEINDGWESKECGLCYV
jgi:hypothetical protein